MTRTPPTVEVIVFAAGLAAAAAAGVYGYRAVGLYGDGPFAAGYHREADPRSGESVLVREVLTSKGPIRHIIDNLQRTREVQIDLDGDGVMESASASDAKGGVRVGVDLDKNGTIERWEYYGADARIERVGTSSTGNGVEDTWSYPDAAGLLLKEEFDTDQDGRIDKRHLYVAPPESPSARVLSVVEMGIDRSGRPERRMYYRPDGSFDRVEKVAR